MQTPSGACHSPPVAPVVMRQRGTSTKGMPGMKRIGVGTAMRVFWRSQRRARPEKHADPHLRTYPGFLSDEQGSLVIFAMFLFVAMLLVGGVAVDLARYEATRAELQSTLDRAVLAAASLSQSAEPEDVVLDYFTRANLDAYIDPNDISSEVTLVSRRVAAEASMEMGTTFMRLLGINSLHTPSAGTAEESAGLTEVSLVLDVSGSMGDWSYSGGDSKIAILREAATEFVNILMCDPSDPSKTTNCVVEPDTVSITMVPYAQQVLAGENILDQLTVTEEHQESSCITFDPDDFNDVAIDPTVTYKRTGNFDKAWWRDYPDDRYLECRTHPWRKILPMENDAQDLRDAIDALGAAGNTSTDIGMKWGAAFLDPTFRSVVQGLVANGDVDAVFSDRPFDYTQTGANKIIVLMTDGYNTDQYFLQDQYRDGPSGIFYNSANESRISVRYGSSGNFYWLDTDDYYWYWNWTVHDHPYGDEEYGDAVEYTFPQLWDRYTLGWYDDLPYKPYPGDHYGRSEKNDMLTTLCDEAKRAGITIYAVGFEVSSSSATVMNDCASSPAHYFDVDGADLSDAFNAIARQITALRLVN